LICAVQSRGTRNICMMHGDNLNAPIVLDGNDYRDT